MQDTIRIFIGHDKREDEAWRVCNHSLLTSTSQSLDIQPLGDVLHRGYRIDGAGNRIDSVDGRPFSTDFSFSRFLVPHLCDYKGWAIFCDADFLFLEDVAELWALRDNQYAVMCVQHEQVSRESVKMDGQVQQSYSRKNWSSLVLWNCGHPANSVLTREEVKTKPGSWLHGFKWLTDGLIGSIPSRWNHLVEHDHYRPLKEISALHYTIGGPWFEDYRYVGYAELYLKAREEMNDAARIPDIPGTSEATSTPGMAGI